MTKIDPWQPERILNDMDVSTRANLDTLNVLPSCPSTMDACPVPMHDGIAVCLSETQTQGRGQHHHAWSSPPQSGIWLSMCYRTHQLAPHSALPLHIAWTVLDALQLFNGAPPLQIKWPNDLYTHQHKFSGVLVESQSQGLDFIMKIGIGITLYDHPNGPKKPHCAPLDVFWPNMPDRHTLLSALLKSLFARITQHPTTWPNLPQTLDMLYGRMVTVSSGDQQHQGLADGIDTQGALRLRCATGQLHIIRQGHVIAF